MSRKVKPQLLENVLITGIADKGKAVGRHLEQVIFVDQAVPGDLVDVMITRKKSGYREGRIHKMVKPSEYRRVPFCKHFEFCGGCKWQHFSYDEQLVHKELEVKNALARLGKVEVGEYLPIAGADNNTHYRNKLEFTFSNRRWLTDAEIKSSEDFQRDGMGFHIAGHFDKVLDLDECFLQGEPSESIRKFVKNYVRENNLSFQDLKKHEGLLRNLIVRVVRTGEVMVTLVVGEDKPEQYKPLLEALKNNFNITSLNYVINTKLNDTIFDLSVQLYDGKPFIIEKLGGVSFKIGPKSFFQTNGEQAEVLYSTAKDFAGLTGSEKVFDLYTGVGSIACFVADQCSQIVGIEEIPEAIADAKENAALNNIENAYFYAGDVKELLTKSLVEKHGKPDVVITDPPRAGMHESVVNSLLELAAPKIVYVSCNPATQARDISLLSAKYKVLKSRAVDMFPHTHHIENVVLLQLIS